jgi:hypothetical protein
VALYGDRSTGSTQRTQASKKPVELRVGALDRSWGSIDSLSDFEAVGLHMCFQSRRLPWTAGDDRSSLKRTIVAFRIWRLASVEGKGMAVTKLLVLATLIAVLIVPGPASGDPATVLNETIVIPLEGGQLSHPCTGVVLGTFTTGTLILRDHVTQIGVNGTGSGHRTGHWRDVEAVGVDGSIYRVVASSADVSMFRQENGTFVGTGSNNFMIFGPEGLLWRGQVVFHTTSTPDGGHFLQFVHASPDALCQ